MVVLNLEILEDVAKGQNLISLLRKRYEAVRLDIRETVSPEPPPPGQSRK